MSCSHLSVANRLVHFQNNFLEDNYNTGLKHTRKVQAASEGGITVPTRKAKVFFPDPLSCFPPPPSFLPPLAEPWASSCWLNFLDDVRVHVRRPCRWCFWMNEYPLPSPLLVLRDVYKSRSPGQPAEFHAILRWKSEMLRDTAKNTFNLVCRNYAVVPRMRLGYDSYIWTRLPPSRYNFTRWEWQNLCFLYSLIKSWTKETPAAPVKSKGKFFFLSLFIMSVLVVSNHM